ncbi:MAG: DNA-deoxyinosine glycosylase [Candidatus Marinimicrobia bacterium]|nr:DNA-deoxyinosine glycosylase [Candidatus Neomarinimicrobiota bacterium]
MRTDNITIIATNTEPKSRSSSNLVYSKSFPPILGPKPRVLILGTMPGKESLKRQQYYANPRNLFWRLIYNLHDAHHEDSYSDRVSFLINKNISVWDVCHKGIRETSLDSDIKDEISNDLESFLKTNSTIKIIAFNGQKAEKLYNKYYSRLDGIAYFTLLSTSPANASYSFDEKFADWSKIIKL